MASSKLLRSFMRLSLREKNDTLALKRENDLQLASQLQRKIRTSNVPSPTQLSLEIPSTFTVDQNQPIKCSNEVGQGLQFEPVNVHYARSPSSCNVDIEDESNTSICPSSPVDKADCRGSALCDSGSIVRENETSNTNPKDDGPILHRRKRLGRRIRLTRAKIDEMQHQLRDARLRISFADEAFVKLAREKSVQKFASSNEDLLLLEEHLSRLQAARDEYSPLEESYNALEKQLDREESELLQLLENDSTLKHHTDDSRFSSRFSDGDGSDGPTFTQSGHHTLYDEYLSKLGDASLVHENLAELQVHSQDLHELQESRKKVGLQLTAEEQKILDNYSVEKATLIEKLRGIKADATILRVECVKAGLIDEGDEDILSISDVSIISGYGRYHILREHPNREHVGDLKFPQEDQASLEKEEGEQERKGADVLDNSNSLTSLEHERFSLLLERPFENLDEEPDLLISDVKDQNSGDRIMRWLQKSPSPCSEMVHLAPFCAPYRMNPHGDIFNQNTLNLSPSIRTLEPDENIPKYSVATMSGHTQSSYEALPSSVMISPEISESWLPNYFDPPTDNNATLYNSRDNNTLQEYSLAGSRACTLDLGRTVASMNDASLPSSFQVRPTEAGDQTPRAKNNISLLIPAKMDELDIVYSTPQVFGSSLISISPSQETSAPLQHPPPLKLQPSITKPDSQDSPTPQLYSSKNPGSHPCPDCTRNFSRPGDLK